MFILFCVMFMVTSVGNDFFALLGGQLWQSSEIYSLSLFVSIFITLIRYLRTGNLSLLHPWR